MFVNVLNNDFAFPIRVNDSMLNSLTVQSITTQASNGQCDVSLDLKQVTYKPNVGFLGGIDTCVYEACDATDDCDIATIVIDILGIPGTTVSLFLQLSFGYSPFIAIDLLYFNCFSSILMNTSYVSKLIATSFPSATIINSTASSK